MARGTIREERPDLLKCLVNEEDGELSCGSSRKLIKVKCPECGGVKNTYASILAKCDFYCNNCHSIKLKRPDLLQYLVNEEDANLPCGSGKKIKVKCPECGFIKERYISSLVKSKEFRCDNCNSLEIKKPDLIKYLVNFKDGNLSCYSEKRIKTKCLDCGYIKEITVGNLSQNGFSCPKCGDGISYPNKFVFNILEQLNINFISEKTFKWSENKRYDFYIPKLKCIVEAHGNQHYGSGFSKLGGRTLQEEQGNDKLKKELALANKIKHYIVLDCRKSELEWIKNSIMNSELPKILKFKEENVNWIECERYTTSNLIKEICRMYNSEKDISKISKYYKIHKGTIWSYLKKGTDLGFCNYNAEESNKKRNKKFSQFVKMHNSKKVFYNGTIYSSCIELSKEIKINNTTINKWLMGKNGMPKEYYDKGLRYVDGDNSKIKIALTKDEKINKLNIVHGKRVICNNVLFKSIQECASYYNNKRVTFTAWLNNRNTGSENCKYFINTLGLRYYNPEVDGDIEQYEQYIETKAV